MFKLQTDKATKTISILKVRRNKTFLKKYLIKYMKLNNNDMSYCISSWGAYNDFCHTQLY